MIEYTVYAKDRSILQSGIAQDEDHVRHLFQNHYIEFGVARPIVPPLAIETYVNRRRRAYPSIGDQLDALWRGGDAAMEMAKRIADVKALHPKDTA